MLLPIVLLGDPVLRKVAAPVPADYPDLKKLSEDMFLTMYSANGVGLAAPQIGRSIRMFVVDGTELTSGYPECRGFKRCMINPEIIDRSDEEISKEEGCLSIPGVYESVKRPTWIVMRYLDADLQEHEERIEGYAARMTMHEYDHLDGKVFVDKVSPLRKTFIKNKLQKISKGKVSCSYRTKPIK